MWGRLEEAQDRILKKQRRRRIGDKGGERIIESAWMTEDIRKGIKKKKRTKQKS